MAGDTHQVDRKCVEGNGTLGRDLNRVHVQQDAGRTAQRSDLLDGLQRPHFALPPDQRHQLGWPCQERTQGPVIDQPPAINRNSLHRPAQALQLQRSRFAGGMFHGGEQQPWRGALLVSDRAGASEEREVDGFGPPRREHHLPAATQQAGDLITAALQLFGRRQTKAMQARGVGPSLALDPLDLRLHLWRHRRGGCAIEVSA